MAAAGVSARQGLLRGREVSETRRQSTRMAVDTKAPARRRQTCLSPPRRPHLLHRHAGGWSRVLAGGVGWSWPAGVMPAWLPAFLDAWPGDELGWLMCGRTPLAPRRRRVRRGPARALSRTHLRPSRPRASPAPHPSTASARRAPLAPPPSHPLNPSSHNTKLGPRGRSWCPPSLSWSSRSCCAQLRCPRQARLRVPQLTGGRTA